MGVRFVIKSAEGKALAEEASYGFEQSRIVIGRGAGADVRIPHLTVSETHATVRLEGDAYSIFDNDSKNGTLVNATRLVPGRGKRLQEGDRIEVGAYSLAFQHRITLSQPTTMERTAELARRLFRQSQQGTGVQAPRLCVLSGPDMGKSLEVPHPPSRLILGSAPSCQFVLADAEVAAEHAELLHDLDGVMMRASDPKRPLQINGQQVSQRRMRDGDELVLGSTRLLFEEPADEPIDALGGEADRALPAAPAPTVGNEAGPDPSKAALPSSVPPSRLRSRPPPFDADVLIYALAAIVIALSVAGLVVLMRAK